MADFQDMQIIDPGVDDNIAKLTPDRIEKTINKVLTQECDARLEVYLQTCVHCGLCAESCQSYISRNGDPDYAPVAKVKDTLWEMVKRKGKVDARVPPQRGAHRVHRLWSVPALQHVLPVRHRHLLSDHDRAADLESPGRRSPVPSGHNQQPRRDHEPDVGPAGRLDRHPHVAGGGRPGRAGRDPHSARQNRRRRHVLDHRPEPKILAQLIANMAIIFKVAGTDWTMPSTDGWDNSNMAMYSGDFETMGRVERLHWDRAMQLKVKRIVMGECGHAYRGAVYDGPRWLGWTKPPIPMVHAVEFYYDLLKSGRIKIARKIEEPVTVQDPCNIVRGRGLHEKLRYVVNEICEDFRDMDPRYEHNYCCQAGGGLINCGPPWKLSRMKSNKVKAEQIGDTGAHTVITPCHNCHSGIEDIIGHYKLGCHVSFISEMLVKTMEMPEA